MYRWILISSNYGLITAASDHHKQWALRRRGQRLLQHTISIGRWLCAPLSDSVPSPCWSCCCWGCWLAIDWWQLLIRRSRCSNCETSDRALATDRNKWRSLLSDKAIVSMASPRQLSARKATLWIMHGIVDGLHEYGTINDQFQN